jgi:hypothetical protein
MLYAKSGRGHLKNFLIANLVSVVVLIPAFIVTLVMVYFGGPSMVDIASTTAFVVAYPIWHSVLCLRTMRRSDWWGMIRAHLAYLLPYGLFCSLVLRIPTVGVYVSQFFGLTFPVLLFTAYKQHVHKDVNPEPSVRQLPSFKKVLVFSAIAVAIVSLALGLVRFSRAISASKSTAPWIYYSNASDNGRLYRVRTDGTGRTKIGNISGTIVGHVEGRLYYIGSDYYGLYMVHTDGSRKQELTADSVHDAILHDGWIYYANGSDGLSVCRVKQDGSSREKLNLQNSRGLLLADGWIFYTSWHDNMSLHKMRLDGTLRTRLNRHNTGHIQIVGGWIYYSNFDDGKSIYKMKTDGTGLTKLTNDKGWVGPVVNGWIYYTNESDRLRLYRIRTDGTGRMRIVDDFVTRYEVVGNTVYYINLTDGDRLYSVNIDGKLRTQITSTRVTWIEFLDGDLYYGSREDGAFSTRHSLYRLEADGSGSKKITDDEVYELLLVPHK